jgi:BirA family transcriptional regulator, biotin operon repressor / biotin---[acetyl-CoA-carboxylase] ligase
MTELALRLLRLLTDGEYHSGAALARELGVSRGTVWNAVRALEDAGLDIYRVRARGYRVPQAPSLLDRAAIMRHALSAPLRIALEIVDIAASTNTLLMERAAAGAPGATVIAAEYQHSGRGRMGREWHAELGGGLTYSLLWRFSQGASALAGLSLAAGVALVRAIEKLGACDVQLKWPNDVLWRGGKLAGMLIEMQGDALGPSAVVIGIGVNVRLSDELRSRVDQPTADLESACGRAIDRSAALGVMIAELAAVLEGFSAHGFRPFRAEWQRYHVHQNKRVTVKLPGGRSDEGIARGVAEDGALLFDTGSAVRRLHSGEISLREAHAEARAAGARQARTRERT